MCPGRFMLYVFNARQTNLLRFYGEIGEKDFSDYFYFAQKTHIQYKDRKHGLDRAWVKNAVIARLERET